MYPKNWSLITIVPNNQSLITIISTTNHRSPLFQQPITDHHYSNNWSLITIMLTTDHWSPLSWQPFTNHHHPQKAITDHHFSRQPITDHPRFQKLNTDHHFFVGKLIFLVQATNSWSPLFPTANHWSPNNRFPTTDHHYPNNRSLITMVFKNQSLITIILNSWPTTIVLII